MFSHSTYKAKASLIWKNREELVNLIASMTNNKVVDSNFHKLIQLDKAGQERE